MESLPNHGLSLVWSSLRNLIDSSNMVIPEDIRLVDIMPGYFPADAYNPIPLELPRGGERKNLSGRFNALSSELWDEIFGKMPSRARIVQLPLYTYNSTMSYKEARTAFSEMLKIWNETPIPESVPCAALAIRVRGGYSNERNAESVFVLLLWPNLVARTLQLDWYEGPLEDCISPEWYVRASPTLPLQIATDQAIKFVMTLPCWSNLRMTLLPKPAFLGYRLQNGSRRREESGGWLCEWDYDSIDGFLEDTRKIVKEMESLLMGTPPQDNPGKSASTKLKD